MEWVRMQEMMAAPPAPAMVKHHSHLHRRSDSIGMDLPTSDVHGHGRMDDPKPFVLVDSKNRVRELTSTAPIKIPATKPLTMPMSVPSRATMMEDQPMMDEQAQLEQQLQMQKEEMHFHRPLPRPQLNQGAPYPPTSSGHEQRPLLFGHAFTYSDNNSQSFMNPLKTPPTVPPISPFAGLALSAPAKTTISSAKNPFASRFGAPSSSSSISDNSPRLPSLNAFRSGSPGPLKMGIAAPRPPPLSLRTGESGSQSMSGLPTSMPSMSPPVQTSFVNFSSSLSTQPSTPLFAPSQPPSHGFSHSLPSVSFLSERRANNMSFDGSESITMSMEVQVKVVRANVWLSARYVDQQDGFLAVARLNGQERVSHATMEPQPSSARAKKYSSVAVKWEEDATLVPFQLQLQSHQEPQLDEQADEQHAAPVRIDISVFLCRKPCRETRKPNTFVFVGHGALTLRQADVDAALSSRQVLFVISLVDGIGDVQVKLQVLTPQDKQRQAQSSPDQGGGGFAIHWSSMAALQQDLEDKARRKAEGEQKLLLRLRKHEDRVLELKRLRAQVLDAMHVHRAARRIQAMFRTNLERQRYERDRHRRAEEARRQAKKAAARQRVLERNQLRSQLMLDRLRQYTNETRSPQAKSKVDTTRSTKPAPMSGQGGNLSSTQALHDCKPNSTNNAQTIKHIIMFTIQ
ncbi:TPA: hypothetical protein N0F65_012244 [Lagenidium giganteum]|uniref:C2 domain-containing protein n=1 Tax=Lagenidium giganteum TaxID=4803 RepID=A0AAV2ZB50_9STRA|nr:TPA: hypothetical protein N0F65_012244 [Lagenidium giganteum]